MPRVIIPQVRQRKLFGREKTKSILHWWRVKPGRSSAGPIAVTREGHSFMNAFWAEIPIRVTRNLVAISCAAILVPGDLSSLARPMLPQAAAATEEAARVPPEQLDSLVAPIALYPDPMLSQTLVASTYPLEIIQLQQWLEKNKSLKDKALADAVKKQD